MCPNNYDKCWCHLGTNLQHFTWFFLDYITYISSNKEFQVHFYFRNHQFSTHFLHSAVPSRGENSAYNSTKVFLAISVYARTAKVCQVQSKYRQWCSVRGVRKARCGPFSGAVWLLWGDRRADIVRQIKKSC